MGFLAAAAPFIAAGASIVKGVGGFMAGKANQKAANAQARDEINASTAQESQVRQQARTKMGQQIAAQWGNGLEGGTGSALDALAQSQIEAALDVAEVRKQGVSKYQSLRAQGKQAATQGAFDLAGGLLGAASSFANSKTDWAQARSGTTPASKSVAG